MNNINALLADLLRGQQALTELNQQAPEMFAAIRQERGWSMQTLAERLNVGKSYISLIESGQRPVTPEVLVRLYNVLREQKCLECGMMMINVCSHCGHEAVDEPTTQPVTDEAS